MSDQAAGVERPAYTARAKRERRKQRRRNKWATRLRFWKEHGEDMRQASSDLFWMCAAAVGIIGLTFGIIVMWSMVRFVQDATKL